YINLTSEGRQLVVAEVLQMHDFIELVVWIRDTEIILQQVHDGGRSLGGVFGLCAAAARNCNANTSVLLARRSGVYYFKIADAKRYQVAQDQDSAGTKSLLAPNPTSLHKKQRFAQSSMRIFYFVLLKQLLDAFCSLHSLHQTL